MHENLCHPGFRDPYGDVSVKLKSHRLENEMRIYFCEFVRAFSDAMNLISPEVKNHHEKVGYIACELAKELKMSRQDLKITFFGAMLHDIGSLMMEGDISLLDLEVHPLRLARMGSQLLRESPVTNALADVVGNCQTPWQKLKASVEKKPLIPQVIHLADVVSLLLTEEKPVLNQIADMKECIHQVREGEFHPDVLRAFDSLCTKEYIWMNVMYHSDVIMDHIPDDHEMSLDEILATTEFMSHIIDFRSPFATCQVPPAFRQGSSRQGQGGHDPTAPFSVNLQVRALHTRFSKEFVGSGKVFFLCHTAFFQFLFNLVFQGFGIFKSGNAIITFPRIFNRFLLTLCLCLFLFKVINAGLDIFNIYICHFRVFLLVGVSNKYIAGYSSFTPGT